MLFTLSTRAANDLKDAGFDSCDEAVGSEDSSAIHEQASFSLAVPGPLGGGRAFFRGTTRFLDYSRIASRVLSTPRLSQTPRYSFCGRITWGSLMTTIFSILFLGVLAVELNSILGFRKRRPSETRV